MSGCQNGQPSALLFGDYLDITLKDIFCVFATSLAELRKQCQCNRVQYEIHRLYVSHKALLEQKSIRMILIVFCVHWQRVNKDCGQAGYAFECIRRNHGDKL